MSHLQRRRRSPAGPAQLRSALYPSRPRLGPSDPACATWPRSRTAGCGPRPWRTSPSWSGSPRPRCAGPPPSTTCSTPSRSGTYLVAVCTNIACLLGGAAELLEHAEDPSGSTPGGPPPTGPSPSRRPSAWPTATGRPACRSTTASSGPRRPSPSTGWWPTCGPGAWAADIPEHGTLIRVRRSVGLEADPATGGRRAGGRGRGPGRPTRPQAKGRGLMARHRGTPDHHRPARDHDDSPHPRALPGHRRLRGPAQGADHDPRGGGAEVDTASLLGRGGAGFPAGRKWSMLRKDPVTYLVVNGDESEPATFKDHLLIERDPHQLIEGVLIAAYALQVTQAFIYIRGEFALGLERVPGGLNDAYAHGAAGTRHLRLGVLGRRRGPSRGRGLHLRRGDGPARVARGQAGLPPHQAAVLPRRHRPLRRSPPWSTTSRPCPTCRGSSLNGGAAFAALGEGRSTGTRLFALAGHVKQPGRLRARDGQDHLPGPHLRPGARRRHPRRQRAEGLHPRRGVGPVVRSRPGRPAARARTRWPRPAPCSARARSS